MGTLARKRGSAGMLTTWSLCVVGSLHIVVSIPTPEDEKRSPKDALKRTILHYSSAGCCVLGLGYGFAHPRSTSPALKAYYLASALALGAALFALRDDGGEDSLEAPYLRRVIFMASEYSVFLAGAIAIGQPLVAKRPPSLRPS